MLKHFLKFSKAERTATMILIATISIVVAFSFANLKRIERRQKEYEQKFIINQPPQKAEIKKQEVTKTYSNKNIKPKYFNPNKATKEHLRSIGLSEFVVSNIMKYRAKGGKFRTKEAFAKIYGLKENDFLKLKEYIILDEDEAIKDTREKEHKNKQGIREFEKHSFEKVDKLAKGQKVEINTADTTKLKKIPQVGSYRAKRIIKYRDRLGGFHKYEQLEETGIDIDIREWINIDTTKVQKININTATFNEINRHPYISYQQVKTIIRHRKKYGNIRSIAQLKMYNEFTTQDIEKIQLYIEL